MPSSGCHRLSPAQRPLPRLEPYFRFGNGSEFQSAGSALHSDIRHHGGPLNTSDFTTRRFPTMPSIPFSMAAGHGLVPKCESNGLGWCFRIRSTDSRAGGAPYTEWEPPCRTAGMARVEAALLVADGPMSPRRIAQVARLSDSAQARRTIEQLNVAYDHSDCAYRVERVAGGLRLLTRPEYAVWLDRLHQRQASLRLSAAAMETLTIVAYRQPLTRADVEAAHGTRTDSNYR